MKRRHALTAAFLVSLACSAQQYRYQTGFTVSQQHFCDTIPIEFDGDQVYLPVNIDGRQCRFLLDTGSSQGVVYTDTPIAGSQELGNIVSIDAIGRRDTVQVVSLPDLGLGRLTLSGYVATVHRRAVSRHRFDGIIGFDLFHKGIAAKIDVRAGHMVLTDLKATAKTLPTASEQEGGLKYTLRWHVPHVWVSPFVRHRDLARFDTGSRQLYAMNKQSFDSHEQKSHHNVQSQVEGRSVGQLAIGNFGAEQQDTVVFLALDRLRWGQCSFLDVHSVTTQGASCIGASILRYGTMTINPFRKRLVFSPYDRSDSISVGNAQFQIAFVPHDNMPAVGLVWEQSEAYKRGFRQGDVILQIDGRPVRDFSHFVQWGFEDGREYLFTVRDRRGFMKEVRSNR